MRRGTVYKYILRILKRDNNIVQVKVEATSDLSAMRQLYIKHRNTIESAKHISLGDPIPVSKAKRDKAINYRKASLAREKKKREESYMWTRFDENGKPIKPPPRKT